MPENQLSSVPTYKTIDRLYKELASVEDQKTKAEKRREFRRHEIDLEKLRKEQVIPEWGTCVPQRMIDEGINMDVPGYVKPIMEARSLVSLINMADPTRPGNDVAEFFTTQVRYGNWLDAWVKAADSLAEQGGVCMEILFDAKSPAFSSINYFPREQLRLPTNVKTIDDTDIIGRRIYQTAARLKAEFQREEYNYKKELLPKIIGNIDGVENRPYDEVYVDRIYFRHKGKLYQAFCHENCDEFLRTNDPVPLGNIYKEPDKDATGALTWKDPVRFPITVGVYKLVSERGLLDQKGRVYYDAPAQEAATEMWSGVVNATIRSGHVYGSTQGMSEANDFTETAQLKPNSIVKANVNFVYPPPPSADLVSAVRAFSEDHKRNSGRYDVASMQKKYQSAREVAEASGLAATFALNQSLPWAMFVREVFTTCWSIFQYMVYKYSIDDQGALVPAEANPLPYANLVPKILVYYEVMDGGVAKMLKEQEDARNLMTLLAQIPNNPFSLQMMQKLNQIMFPSYADEWNLVKAQMDQLVQTLYQVGQILVGQFMTEAQKPEEERQLAPAELMNLQQIINQLNATLAPYGLQLGKEPNTAVG